MMNMSFKKGNDDTAKSISELVDVLQDVDEKAPSTAGNETTISDNNGGKIKLNDNAGITTSPSSKRDLKQPTSVTRVVLKKDTPKARHVLIKLKHKPKQVQTEVNNYER